MGLAPSSDRNSADLFVWALDEMHQTPPAYQIAGCGLEQIQSPAWRRRGSVVGQSNARSRSCRSYLTFIFVADSLPRLLSISSSTACHSLSALRPARSTALMRTNTS